MLRWCFAVLQSTVCKKIVELLDQQNVDILDHRVGIISQDCFYRELDDKERALAAKGFFDFDHPSENPQFVVVVVFVSLVSWSVINVNNLRKFALWKFWEFRS